MFPPELQEAMDFLQQLPFYIRLITIMSVASVVLTTLVGVGVIVQLNRLIGALRTTRGDAAGALPLSTAPSTASAGPPPQYGPSGTSPYGSVGPYGQSGSAGSGPGNQSPWT